MIRIPPEQINADTLTALIEEYVTRDGTDYGDVELTLAQKVALLRDQLQRNEVVIVFDLAAEQANLLTREQYRQWQVAQPQDAPDP